MASTKEILYSARKKAIKFDDLRKNEPEFIDGVRNWIKCPECGIRVLIEDLPYFERCPKCHTGWTGMIESQGLKLKDYRERLNWESNWYKFMTDDEIMSVIKQSAENSLDLERQMVLTVNELIVEGNKIWNKYYIDIQKDWEKCIQNNILFIKKLFKEKEDIDKKDLVVINKNISSSFKPVYEKVSNYDEKEKNRNTVISYLEGIEMSLKIDLEDLYMIVKRLSNLDEKELYTQDEMLKRLGITKEDLENIDVEIE